MIVCDTERCRRCGQCIEVCHEHCMTLTEDSLQIDYDLCSTCAQCIALCPHQALSWDGVRPSSFNTELLPSPEQLTELLRERRTTRKFTPDKIDHGLLEEIIGCGVYAPTNNYAFRVIAIDDDAVIAELDAVIQRWNRLIYRLFYQSRIVAWLIGSVWRVRDYVQARPKVEASLRRGHAIHRAAAMILVVGDRRTPLSIDSAQYALYNMILYAQVKGIGSCLWGPGRLSLNRSRATRERLGLDRHERIFGSMLLGYPAVKFKNRVEGKTLPIQLNTSPQSAREP